MTLPERHEVDHTAARGQGWRDADDDLKAWIDSVTGVLEQLDDLCSVILHGSLATGSFHRPKSDVDLLVIVDAAPTARVRAQVARELVEHHDRRPITGGLELSVVLTGDLERFDPPLPYLLHVGENWADHIRNGGDPPSGIDPDLGAHAWHALDRGIALAGDAPSTILANATRAAYIDAIVDDLRWLVVERGLLETPYYGVLNICRCAHVLLGDAKAPSKVESALWALDQLPTAHHGPIADALECYRAGGDTSPEQRRTHGHRWDEQPLLALADFAVTELL